MKRPSVRLQTIVACFLTVAAVAASPRDHGLQFRALGTQAGQGAVTGIVRERLTGAPIAGALVTVSPGGLTSVTNGAGVYQVTLPVGTFSLTVSVPNRPSQSAFGVVVRNGSTTTVNFVVALPGGTGLLTGHVRDAATNAPIANTNVSVSPSGKSTATDANGRYELWIPKGTYTVSASEACSVAASAPGVVVSSQTITTRDLQLLPLEHDVIDVLHVFASTADGENPGTLIQATDGDLYGTAPRNGNLSRGTIFKMTPAGTFTPLHQFAGGVDGALPDAPLIQATDADFYGTTSAGGAANSGTVYKMTSAGDVTVLHAFTVDVDGKYPSELIQGTDGDFYGTTSAGGPSDYGTVFKMTPGGIVTVLHAFSRGADGAFPNGGLIQATDGNFYGTTSDGGSSDLGTVFTMTPAGIVTVLHAFSGYPDGAYPYVGLIQASDGDFYGTTGAGGSSNTGSIFRMTPAGEVTILHSWSTDAEVSNRLIQATDGNFYGTTFGDFYDDGYIYHGGSIFRMTPAGTFVTLYTFPLNGTDVSSPCGALVQGTDGAFYGTTCYGGIPHEKGRGTLFRMRSCRTPATLGGSVPDRAKKTPFGSRSVRQSLGALMQSIGESVLGKPAHGPRWERSTMTRPARTTSQVRAAHVGAWEIEAFGGATFASQPSVGTSALPPPGAPFVTATGEPSRRVSSWYFSDGAQLLNGVNTALGVSQTIAPLDDALNASLAERSSGGGGVRVSRILTPRLAAELTVEFSAVRADLSSDASTGIEASRASFLSAWEGLASAGQFVDTAVTSVRTLQIDNGQQVVATGAINVALKKDGKVIPYLTLGAGVRSNSGTTVSAGLVGDYRFLMGGITPVHETDSVTVRYAVADQVAVGVLGAGFKYMVSPRLGLRFDYRTYLGPNRSSTTLACDPIVSTLTPAGSGASTTTPGIQFSNDLGIGVESSLSGPAIADFRTFTGTGAQGHAHVTMGVFWRF